MIFQGNFKKNYKTIVAFALFYMQFLLHSDGTNIFFVTLDKVLLC